jgi:hypothetical protein
VYNILIRIGKKENANNLMFIMHLPYRGVARMSGVLTEEQVLALLRVINREKGGWCSFAKSLVKWNKYFTKREK